MNLENNAKQLIQEKEKFVESLEKFINSVQENGGSLDDAIFMVNELIERQSKGK